MKSALVALLLGSSASAFTIGQRAVLRRPTGRASTTMKAHDQTPVATGPALALAALLAAGAASPLAASANEVVGSIPASGFIFKDTLDITRFADPKVSGVSLYVSDFSKPITERLGGDFFTDPSTASITCVTDGPVKLDANVAMGKEGEEVFSEAKSLLFKSVKVRRIVDKESGNIVYVSYSQRLSQDKNDKGRFKSSLCAVHMNPATPAPAPAAKPAP